MTQTPIAPQPLEGPVTMYQVDGLWRITVHPSETDAARHAIDLSQLRISNRAFVSYLPRTIFTLADPLSVPQPEDP